MKKTFLFLATCLAMTMAATSCGDFIETSDNGDLDGYWQLSQVDTLANGVQVDMTSSKVFWGVQGKFLTMLDTRQAPSYGYMFRFEHRADSLLLSDGRVNDRNVNDTLLTNVDVLRLWESTSWPNTSSWSACQASVWCCEARCSGCISASFNPKWSLDFNSC